MNTSRSFIALAVVAWTATTMPTGLALTYDPLAAPEIERVQVEDLDVIDDSRDRTIPIRVYRPPAGSDARHPVVLFSHGLGGSREGSKFLGNHWAARGYVAVFLQHPGSDSAVWRGQPVGRRMDAIREAASLENLLLRVEDVPAVLDQLETWNKAARSPLGTTLDMARVGMSGHSFGAQTTQSVSGQSAPLAGKRLSDPRISAAVIMSPGSPRGMAADRFFGSVDLPWMLMTGTKDTSVIGGQTIESRLAVYPALPPGGKYELVLDNAEHSAFTDRALPGDREPRNPNHHRAILALSTAFWDAYLRGDDAARTWLDGNGPRTVLEAEDGWQRK
jgi:predicted dienelactone hydrolase